MKLISDLQGGSGGITGISKVGNDYICLVCGHLSKTLSNAKGHYKFKHLPQTPAECEVCHKVFKNTRSRNEHRGRVHKISNSMLANKIPF